MLALAGLSMAEQYQWGPAQFAVLQSAYLAGYPLTQMLGGAMADRVGARVVFALAVAAWRVPHRPVCAKRWRKIHSVSPLVQSSNWSHKPSPAAEQESVCVVLHGS